MRRQVRTGDGLDIAVVEFGGAGEPILLLHGLMGRATTWWPVARWLTAHGRVLGHDARGHGRSGAHGPFTTERMAADAAEVLESLRVPAPAMPERGMPERGVPEREVPERGMPERGVSEREVPERGVSEREVPEREVPDPPGAPELEVPQPLGVPQLPAAQGPPGARGSVGRAVVIGHSMGGLHGLALAAARPDLVRALVVEDMGIDFRGQSVEAARAWFGALPEPFESLAAVRAALSGPRPEFGEYMAECVEERANGYHLLARVEHTTEIAAEWAERDYRDLLPHVRCPVLVIEAEESVAPGQPAELARLLPDAHHVRIPGTGHLVHAAAPDAYRAAVQEFLHR